MKNIGEWNVGEGVSGSQHSEMSVESSRISSCVAKLWGGDPVEPLEKRMLEAATSEALSLAWSSGSAQDSYQTLLEVKVREAKQYVRRQRSILGQTEQIIATAF